ncbi:MAG: hypothetical protein V4609_01385, partial [Pseudomonadota bacterium]
MTRRPTFPAKLGAGPGAGLSPRPAATRTAPPRPAPIVSSGIGLDSGAVRARMVAKLATQGIADARVLALLKPGVPVLLV